MAMATLSINPVPWVSLARAKCYRRFASAEQGASGDREEQTPQEEVEAPVPRGGCKTCGRSEVMWGCNGLGRIQGGIGAVPGFTWWPIKAFRPCPAFVESGGRYKRQGQRLEEFAYGRRIDFTEETSTDSSSPTGGVTPEVRNVLQRSAARCLRCGAPADLVEYDKVFKAFFIPVWRWPAKSPALHCNECGMLIPSDIATSRPPDSDFKSMENVPLQCWSCSAPLSPSFRYCPHCGSPTK